MRLPHNFFALFFCLAISILILMESAQANILDQYQWEKRLLIVHSPNVSNLAYKIQLDDYRTHENGVLDRDIKLISLISAEPLDDYEQWASAFHLGENDFNIILVGKDGTEKKRWDQPVPMIEIFKIIDAMPMRQNEAR